MRPLLRCALATMSIVAALAQPQPQEPNPDLHYRLGPDSFSHEGVPKGEIKGPFTLPSQAYPGTQHTYWVYVPAQYDPATPARLMIYNEDRRSWLPRGICVHRT